ncbi:hypothetical protein NL529_34270, partial [Klebsiella pneumoniae]|nr:hypothetical protein [Klebsiella pneumoniae]
MAAFFELYAVDQLDNCALQVAIENPSEASLRHFSSLQEQVDQMAQVIQHMEARLEAQMHAGCGD